MEIFSTSTVSCVKKRGLALLIASYLVGTSAGAKGADPDQRVLLLGARVPVPHPSSPKHLFHLS